MAKPENSPQRVGAASEEKSEEPAVKKSATGPIRTLFASARKKNLGMLRSVSGLPPKKTAGVSAAREPKEIQPLELTGVPDSVARQARACFERGASFYLYADRGEAWRGDGAVDGWVHYIKNPESRRMAAKVYAYTEGTDVQGERRRFGAWGDVISSISPQGEVHVTYGGLRRNGLLSSLPPLTKLSGKALLHVALYPVGAASRGQPEGALSNELLIPVAF